MKTNYLIAHVRRDCLQVFLFGLAALLVGCLPFLYSDYVPLKAAGGFSIVFGLLAVNWGRHALRPMEEPSVVRLARYGRIPEVLESIQRERDGALQVGKVCLSSTWLTACGIGIQVVRVDEIAAVALQETVNRVNGMPAGSTWQLILTLRDGTTVTVHTPHRVGATLLQTSLLLRVS